MMFRGETVVYFENHTEQTNTICRRNAQFYYVKAGGIYDIETIRYERIKKRDSGYVYGVKVAQYRMNIEDFCDYCDESGSSTNKTNVLTSRLSSHTKEDYGQQILRVSQLGNGNCNSENSQFPDFHNLLPETWTEYSASLATAPKSSGFTDCNKETPW